MEEKQKRPAIETIIQIFHMVALSIWLGMIEIIGAHMGIHNPENSPFIVFSSALIAFPSATIPMLFVIKKTLKP